MMLSEVDLAMLFGKMRRELLSEKEVDNLQEYIDLLKEAYKASLLAQRAATKHASELTILFLDTMLGGEPPSTG